MSYSVFLYLSSLFHSFISVFITLFIFYCYCYCCCCCCCYCCYCYISPTPLFLFSDLSVSLLFFWTFSSCHHPYLDFNCSSAPSVIWPAQLRTQVPEVLTSILTSSTHVQLGCAVELPLKIVYSFRIFSMRAVRAVLLNLLILISGEKY
jgi:hypothetical protein